MFHLCWNPSKAPLSPSTVDCQQSGPSPPREKACVWCGKVHVSLPPSHRGMGVATKEIPKVPLQWHRWTVWKLACPLMVQHILAHQTIIRNPWNPPSTITIIISPSFVTWSPLIWNLEKRDYFMFLQAFSCSFFFFFLSWLPEMNQNVREMWKIHRCILCSSVKFGSLWLSLFLLFL